MSYQSILREEEYRSLRTLSLTGRILDVGGSKTSGYHELIAGEHEFFVINIDQSCQPDQLVDVETPYPFSDGSFDHAISLNLLEHVYEFENAFGEMVRSIKPGGKIILATPFLHHIHGSPDDYLRYTESAYRRLASKFQCEIVTVTPLGKGVFSLVFQCVGGAIPTRFLQRIFKALCLMLDTALGTLFKRYRILAARLPLGYFVVMTKHRP